MIKTIYFYDWLSVLLTIMNKVLIVLPLVLIAALTLVVPDANAQSLNKKLSQAPKSKYTKFSINSDYSVEMLSDWRPLKQKSVHGLNDFVKKVLRSGNLKMRDDILFQVNKFDKSGDMTGQIQIKHYPKSKGTQKLISQFGKSELEAFDSGMKENLYNEEKLINKQNNPRSKDYKVLSWHGSKAFKKNDINFIETHYTRNNFDNTNNFDIYLVRVLDGKKSFVIIFSVRQDSTEIKSEKERVINSINRILN